VTILFFLLLAASLAVVTGVVAGAVFLLTLVPSLRSRRGPLMRATVGGTVGCFGGGIVGFVTVLALGLLCRWAPWANLAASCDGVADSASWILLGALPVGLVAGCLVGWQSNRN
jgi:hypothetical protein